MSAENGTLPAVEQMLYTNVDRVVDGQELSGWQTMATTAGMNERTTDWLRGLIDPSVTGMRPLPGYPTPEQIAAADRRLRQIPSAGGTVLIHTAPAGADSTGRTNSMTHALVLQPGQAAPTLRTSDLWRSPGWVVPFGAQAVRDAVLPPAEAFAPGDVITLDAVTDFVLQDGHGAVLAALADALEPVLASRVRAYASTSAPAEPSGGAEAVTVLLGVRSTDESALWIAALQRCCAPLTARHLGYSTLEAAGTTTDVDGIMSSTTDLACVPLEELRTVGTGRAGLIVLDPEGLTAGAPEGTWGRLVAAMTSSVGAWVAGQDGLDTVLSLISDHRELTPAWPLAMAEACEPGLFSTHGDVVANVDRELVTCQPAALAQNPYLTSILTDRLLGSTDTDPAVWYDKLCAVPPGAPAGGVVSGLVHKYLDSAVKSRGWLLDRGRQVSPAAAHWLRAWTTDPEPGRDETLHSLVMTAQHTTGAEDPVSLLLLADRLTRDGAVLGETDLIRMIAAPAQSLAGSDGPRLREQVVGLALGRALMDAVRAFVESHVLAEAGEAAVLPRLSGEVTAWLTADGAGAVGPGLAAEAALAALATAVDAQPALSALNTLGHGFRLAPAVVDSLAALCTPGQALSMTPDCGEKLELVGRVLARDPEGAGANEAAQWCMAVKRHSLQELSRTPLTSMSSETAAALLVLCREVPVVGLDEGAAYCLANNMLVSIQVLLTVRGAWDRRTGPAAGPPPGVGAPPPAPTGLWGASPGLQAAEAPPPASERAWHPFRGSAGASAGPQDGERAEMTPFQRSACDRALALLLLAMWNGRTTTLGSARPETMTLVRQRLELLAEHLEEDPGLLAGRTDRIDSGLVAGAVRRLYLVTADCAPEYWNQQEQGVLTRVESVSHPLLREQDELVQAICRAWVRIFDETRYDSFLAAVMSGLPHDPEAERWVRKNILPASGLKKLGGRFFGGR